MLFFFFFFRTDAFELWCWRRLLRVPWTTRRSNQSILKKINPEYSLEGLKLKLQYFGHLMQRVDSLEKTLTLRQKEKGVAEDEMFKQHHRLNGLKSKQTLGDCGGQRSLKCFSPQGCKESETILHRWRVKSCDALVNSHTQAVNLYYFKRDDFLYIWRGNMVWCTHPHTQHSMYS